jgi:hypothetical protein
MKLIDDRREIALNYLKGWFLIDSVSIFPLDIITKYAGQSGTASYNKFFRILRLGKL